MTALNSCAFLKAVDGEEDTSPKPATEQYNKALELFQHGDYAKAEEAWHAFIGQFPDSPLFRVALYYLAQCHQHAGETKEALTIYNRIVTTYGDDDFWGQQAMKRIKQIKGDE